MSEGGVFQHVVGTVFIDTGRYGIIALKLSLFSSLFAIFTGSVRYSNLFRRRKVKKLAPLGYSLFAPGLDFISLGLPATAQESSTRKAGKSSLSLSALTRDMGGLTTHDVSGSCACPMFRDIESL